MIDSLAIIPCKSLSERLPRKNMMRVGGRTLVERAVYAAQECTAVVIASDDQAILDHGRAFAERVPLQCSTVLLSADHVGKRVHLEDVLADIIARHPARRYVMLQPTSPLRRRRHVASCLAMLDHEGCDSVISVHDVTKDVYFAGDLDERTGRFTPWRTAGAGFLDAVAKFWTGRPADRTSAVQCVPNSRRFTNDLGKLVAENGAVYAWTHDHWIKTGSRMGGDMRAMEMDVDDAIDIDTPAEMERAQRRFAGGET